MNIVTLMQSGTMVQNRNAINDDPLGFLGFGVRLDEGYTLRSYFQMMEIDPEDAALGSTVEQVVLRASCPVASVNHPDKVST